jgi:UDP-glucose 4-epimerase
MIRTLVTGGCGFVGRHVVLKALELGHQVWIVDDLSTGIHPDEWLPAACLAQPDYFEHTHLYDVRYFLRERKLPSFDYVFHFAAVVGGRVKIEGDPMAVAQDLAIDADFFSWAVKEAPARILYASSSAAYPIDLQHPGAQALQEELLEDPLVRPQPDTTYGWSKLTGEYLARIAANHYGLSVACVRPFSGYGEDQDESYPIPAIAARAARHEDPLTIWGPGSQGRDFVHIDDCVEVIFTAIEKISDGSAVNIGSGKLCTFNTVARMFADLAGYEPEIKAQPDKPTGVHSRYCDNSKMKELMGGDLKVSLEEGFKRVYEAARTNA